MMKIGFNKEEPNYFSPNQRTPLHKASEEEYFEAVKFIADKGADMNSIWSPDSLNYRTNVFTLINNFNDPFYQRYWIEDKIPKSQLSLLIENGMI